MGQMSDASCIGRSCSFSLAAVSLGIAALCKFDLSPELAPDCISVSCLSFPAKAGASQTSALGRSGKYKQSAAASD